MKAGDKEEEEEELGTLVKTWAIKTQVSESENLGLYLSNC